MAKSPTQTEFYEALGLAITQWARVEDAFCDLFIRLTICSLTGAGMGMGREKEIPTGEGHFILGNIFYSTSNFRGRIELIGHILERLVSDAELLPEWNAIKNKSGRLYAKRNVLAHGAAWGSEHADPGHMRYSVFSTQEQALDYQQIQQATPSFFNYAERITALAIKVNAHLAQRKRPQEHLADQVGTDLALGAQLNHSRGEPSPPHQP